MNIKLSGDQEKALKPQVDAALKEAQEATERLAPQAAPQGERGQRGGAGNGGGQRRGGPGGFGPNNALTAELKRINDDLIAKINAVLKPEQQAFKKFRSTRSARPRLPGTQIVMEDAGALHSGAGTADSGTLRKMSGSVVNSCGISGSSRS